MKETIKAALIGTGMIANEAHIPAYQAIPGVTATAVCDQNLEAARRCAQRHGIPGVYADAREMLEKEKPDLVTICTPNLTHAAMAKLALESGANVLCEKPLALHYEEAKTLFALARDKGLLLVTCQTMRFQSAYFHIREYVTDGLMGAPYYGEIERIRRRGVPSWGHFLEKSRNGGGALADIGVHAIDLMLWLLGSPAVTGVLGTASRAIIDHERGVRYDLKESGALTAASLSVSPDVSHCDVEEFASGVIRTDGPSINFKIAWAANLPNTTRYLVLGDKMGAVAPDLRLYSTLGHDQADMTPRLFPLGPWDELPFAGHYYLVQNMVHALQGKEKPLILPEETLNTVAVMDLFYRSLALGREARVDELAQK